MALTNADLQAIAQLIQPVKDDMQGLKNDMQDMKDDMQGMKDDMQGMKDDMRGMKDDMQDMKDDMQGMKDDMQVLTNRTANIELTLENQTNHNIQLLAENHLNLVDKLNAAIRVQDKSILCEVQISGLRYRIEALEKEFSEFKSKTA